MNRHPLSEFLAAACVPVGGSHVEGTLDEARSLLAERPHLADESILAAAALGEADAVAGHLAADASLATRAGGPHGWDPLTTLSFSRFLRLEPSRRFVECARLLLDAGADPNTGFYDAGHTPDPVRETALYGAAGIAHHPWLTRLLLERGADPNDDEVVYHAPEGYGSAELEAILDSGRLTADSLVTMLVRKADWHDGAGIRRLLAAGADPNRLSRWGVTALHQAIRRDNSLAIVESLLDAGADPNLANRVDGRTTMEIAALRGRGDVLLEADTRGFGLPQAGRAAVLTSFALTFPVLILNLDDSEPDEAAKLRNDGAEPLVLFAGNGNTAGVRALLDFGIPTDAPFAAGDPYFELPPGSTALHNAAWRARHETVRLLIDRGADVDRPDGWGRTPLAAAVKACTNSFWSDRAGPDSVRMLLAAGASTGGVVIPPELI